MYIYFIYSLILFYKNINNNVFNSLFNTLENLA